MPAQYPSVVIAVDRIRKSMDKITGFGMDIPFFDTEGNRINMIEPAMEMKEKARRKFIK